jgi:hypothetical protein
MSRRYHVPVEITSGFPRAIPSRDPSDFGFVTVLTI